MEDKKVMNGARQENVKENYEGLDKINPCWVTFWTIIFDLKAKLDRMDAEEKATEEAARLSRKSTEA